MHLPSLFYNNNNNNKLCSPKLKNCLAPKFG